MSTIRERVRALVAWARALLAPTSDQLAATGGEIGAGETASLLVQRIIRRWAFLGTITAITFYLWIIRDPIWHHSPADSWNYFLSWLAIAIESVVGMFFFGQSLRDGGVLRRILRELIERVETLIRRVVVLARHILRIERHILAMEREHGEQLAHIAAEQAAQGRQLAAIYALLNAGLSAQAQASEPPPAKPRRSLPDVLADQQHKTAPRKRVSERAKP